MSVHLIFHLERQNKAHDIILTNYFLHNTILEHASEFVGRVSFSDNFLVPVQGPGNE